MQPVLMLVGLLSLRDSDRDELEAATGLDPVAGIRFCLKSSNNTIVADDNGELVAVWGITSPTICSDEGNPWLFTGHAVERNKWEFLYQSKRQVKLWQQDYKRLMNYVDDRHDAAKRWLVWLGFTLSEPVPFGYAQLPFRRFEMRV